MTSDREEILRRIRRSLADVAAPERSEPLIERRYRRAPAMSRGECIELFAERVADYRASVLRVTGEELPAAIAGALARRGVRRLAVPGDIPPEWLPPGIEVLLDVENALSAGELDAVDGVLTGCAAGIAVTGTIVLDGGPLQARRLLSLLPDYHLCVVREEQIVETVPGGIERLRPSARDGRAITLISGPSATSDIELKRVEGVHGPRNLEVIIVTG